MTTSRPRLHTDTLVASGHQIGSLSPLDELSKQSRSLDLDSPSAGAQATGRGQHSGPAEVLSGDGRFPARGSSRGGGAAGGARERDPRLLRGERPPSLGQDKGKQRADEHERENTASAPEAPRDDVDQFADARGLDDNGAQAAMAAAPDQLSPLRNHTFHSGHDSLSTIASLGSSYPNDNAAFDGGDLSPVVPEFGARSGSSQSRHYMPPAERSLPTPDRQGATERQPVVHPDDETESLTADRSTWQSHSDGREPTTSTIGIPLDKGRPRESAMSALSRESTDGDPFHFTVYEFLPSPAKNTFHSHPSSPPSPAAPPQPQPHFARQAPAPLSSSYDSGPIVRIGPPSPDFLPDPHDSSLWQQEGSPESSNYGFLGSAPRTPETAASSPSVSLGSPGGRVKSQMIAKNFSRPIFGPPRGASSDGSRQRSDSYESTEGGQLSSSVGHSSSQGAHSMSSSWEGRVELESRHQNEAKLRAAEAQSLRSESWRAVDRGLDSPAPFSGYGSLNSIAEQDPHRATLTPADPSDDLDSPSYRLDSYYAPGPVRLSAYPPSPKLPDGYPPSPRLPEEHRLPAHPVNSPSKGRNILKKAKSSPSPPETEHHHRWLPFRSKPKVQVAKAREVVPDAESDYRFSGSSIHSAKDAPVITLSQALPPAEIGMSPDDIVRRQIEDEAARRRAVQREKPNYMPGAGKSVVGSYVDGSEGRPRPPGWEATEELEQLDDPMRMPPSLQRGAYDDGGPRRHPDAHSPESHDRSNSLYSNYSFYTFPDDGPQSRSAPPTRQASPNGSPQPQTIKFAPNTNTTPASGTLAKAKAGFGAGRNGDLPVGDPVSPEDFLQLGIKYHEDGDLERSAWYFETSAKKNGGCGAGMLLYGLALRHGWGCQINPELGFRYLQSAAEMVTLDLDKAAAAGGRRATPAAQDGAKVSKNELMLALYEIGTSFRFGWGVTKDKKMAVSYFTLAADLGDPDAQSDLAFCYANGKGCKKNMKEAAKYYRMAVKQGGEAFGLSWIYKPKYMDD